MDVGRRRAIARVAAPAALLAAATVAVLLVRAGLEGGSPGSRSAPVTDVSRTVPPTQSTRTAPPPSRPRRRYYTLRKGDTLARVAARLNTTVERILALNPGIRPTRLRVGQRVRVQ